MTTESVAFEKLVAAVQMKLDPQSSVEHDVHIDGKRSGTPRQVDVAVRGRIGPKDILVAIECRHYKRSIDVPKIDAFVGFLDDIQANAGVMVTTIGYSDAALQRAEAEGIETYVVRPAKDEDWEGYLRSFAITMNLKGTVWSECQVGLVAGETIEVGPMEVLIHPAAPNRVGVLAHILNGVRKDQGWPDGERRVLTIGEPLYFREEVPEKRINTLSAIPSTEEALPPVVIEVTDPKDWVFMRLGPGESYEPWLFEHKKLQAIADTIGQST